MLRKLLLLILGFAAMIAVPAAIFAYTMLKPVVAVEVQFPADDKAELSFFALGDQGVGNLRQWQVAAAMDRQANSQAVDGVFFLGDSFYRYGVESSTDLQWRYKFEHVYEGALAAIPFYATLGNHDYFGDELSLIEYDLENQGSGRWQMPSRDYVRVFGRSDQQRLLKVVFIDSGFWLRSPQDTTTQLENLLSTSEASQWTVVVTHTPQVSANSSDVPPNARALWQTILAAHQVDLVLSGHDHNMQLIEDPAWPLWAIVGVGGKSRQPLENPDLPGLLYSGPGPGFSRLTVNAEALQLEYLDDEGNSLIKHRIVSKPKP
jgi:predicted phosphodiesterase